VLDRDASRRLFNLLLHPTNGFRRRFATSALLSGRKDDKSVRGRPYLNAGHTGLDRSGLADWIGKTGVKPVYFVHDLIPITHPEYCRDGEREKHVRRMQTVLRTGAAVVANSQATIDELNIFAERERLRTPTAIAAWLGTTPLPAPAAIAASDTPTFVTVGTIEARKNHLFLLQLWTRLAQKLGDNCPRLLVVGQRGWESEQASDLLDRAEALKGVVVEVGGCSDAELAAHLSNAAALLFPSLAEGYGLPLVEALAAGVPVIASDLPVFREIGQGIPELLDPLDGPGWERTIIDYAEAGNERRRAQLSRLDRFTVPTWADHLAKVDSLLATL
jgi:glycosyltransferase involved in cell wall biosynthesis